MVNGKLVGGILAFIFAALTGVFVWLADRESADTESKKYKGYYAAAMVSGFLFLASIGWALASWYMSTPVESASEPIVPQTATNIAGQEGGEAAAIAESAPDASQIAKGALAGENQSELMEKAKELKQAGEAAVAKAQVANKTAEQAAATAGNQTAAAHQKATEAAVNAAAKKAAANQAAETLAALSAAEANAAKVEANTRRTAAEQQATAKMVEQKGAAQIKQGIQLQKVIPVAAAVSGGN